MLLRRRVTIQASSYLGVRLRSGTPIVIFRIFVSSGDDLFEPRDLIDDLALLAA